MYPGFLPYWMSRRCGEKSVSASCGPLGHRARFRYEAAGEEGEAQFSGGAFGVRRPLRFLAYKLGLEEAQVAELAKILDELKTERAQAAVDHRRAISAFADAIEGEVFNDERARAGATVRAESAERLRAAVAAALARLHKLLDASQRARLAYLIRTGTLSI
jgi:Spy/CpxP family protein refolding chaperone